MDPLSALLSEPVEEQTRRGTLHTPREIAQQPDTWQKTFSLVADKRQEIAGFLERAGISDSKKLKPTVLLIGAGTSDYIGRCLHHLLRRQWSCEVIPVPSTSLLIDFPEYLVRGTPYLWVSFSRSGESPEGVAVLERALTELPEVHHLIITCNAEGCMIRMAQDKANCLGIVLDDATNDRGLAMTNSFSNMVLAGQLLAHMYGWASWSPRKGILTLRNPSNKPQAITLDVAKVFELPEGAPRRYKAHSPWAADASQPAIELRAGEPYTFHLKPFQVLTLEAQPQ